MTASVRPPRRLLLGFVVSGVAGLIYEVLWSRYLGLYVGHGAYAQVLVLSVYLGGMAVGALAIAGASDGLRSPLRWYAAAELALALFGVGFHVLFRFATDLSYDVLFPWLGEASLVGAARWAIAGALILPQAIVLGTTYPLMGAALVRGDAGRPGRGIAVVYLLNTLGGAAGVLLAGFWWIGALGLPGTSLAAAILNLVAAALAWRVAAAWTDAPDVASTGPARVESGAAPTAETSRATNPSPDPIYPTAEPAGPRIVVTSLIYGVAFGTALASFAYEIGWIRMLSLVLGSASHAFDLMLSAFILGLAVGAWLVRDRADRATEPLRLLGHIQLMMGIAALLSLPVYLGTFDFVATLTRELPGRPLGYELYNLSRYVVCLAVMLPATTLAGMTLPVLTAALLKGGGGESAIGRVYAVNTIGSVVGAGLAGLVGLPALGLEGLVTAGAGLDALLGIALLAYVAIDSGRGLARVSAYGATAVAIFVAVGAATEFSPTLLTSGIFRAGDVRAADGHLSLYYEDGRTATVSAHLGRVDGVIVLSTNGKPDASIGPRWVLDRRDTLPVLPIPAGRDFTTQVLAPMIGLAHNADARSIANIGHGSGMSAASLLTSPTVERLVTIEIEPLMVEGSLAFLPANGPVFADPRSTFVFDDAKSFFSYQQERFDLIFAEPSNPWVSGTASLFTEEFYRRITDFMEEDAVLVQWMQIYELNDELFLSVLAALDAVFPSYRAYQVGDADIAIVARADGPVGDADWSVVAGQGFRALTMSAPPFTPAALDALLLFDETTFRAVLDPGVRANSDFYPILEAGAERARFDGNIAAGVYSFGARRVDLARTLRDVPNPPAPFAMVPAYGLTPAVLSGRAAWLREVLAAGGGIAPEEFPEWMEELRHLQSFLSETARPEEPASWETWAAAFTRAEAALHWGTYGWADPRFYAVVDAKLALSNPPPEAIAAVELARGFANRDWSRVATAADRLLFPTAVQQRWTVPAGLLDMAVVAYLRIGRPQDAREAIDRLVPLLDARPDHLRHRLLAALTAETEATSEN